MLTLKLFNEFFYEFRADWLKSGAFSIQNLTKEIITCKPKQTKYDFGVIWSSKRHKFPK